MYLYEYQGLRTLFARLRVCRLWSGLPPVPRTAPQEAPAIAERLGGRFGRKRHRVKVGSALGKACGRQALPRPRMKAQAARPDILGHGTIKATPSDR